MLRLLQAFGLDAPTTAPAAVWCMTRHERRINMRLFSGQLDPDTLYCMQLLERALPLLKQQSLTAGPSAVAAEQALMGNAPGGLAAARAALRAAGYGSMEQLVSAVVTGAAPHKKAKAFAQVLQQMWQRRHLPPQPPATVSYCRQCKKSPSPSCVRGCCRHCCRPGDGLFCERHNR